MADITPEQDTPTPKKVFLKDYTPPPWQVQSIKLHFELDAADTIVSSELELKQNPDVASSQGELWLDGVQLELLGLELDGQVLENDRYRVEPEGLRIFSVPDSCCLKVRTRIHPQANTALEGLYQSGGMLCTQCEAEGFRRITYFPDRPDVMTTFSVTLDANKQRYPVLLSNGNAVAHGEAGDRHWVRWEDPFPKPSYLFALVAGELQYQQDSFTTLSGREVTLRIYVEPENIAKCDHALASLKQAMSWDEAAYGREYDLDIFNIVAVNDFNMGAMENKSLNIFNSSCVLASPDTATDDDYYNIQSIIGHEYFHNWSGNRVTCRDWFQLSLKEGFTVFRDQQFSADLNSAAVKRIDDVNVLRMHQFAQDAGPMAHPVRPSEYMEISNFYTVTVYNKGAEVVRMLFNLLGAEGFRKGSDLYFGRYDGQAVTTDDFVAAMEEANAVDLTQFRRWYDQAGTPELHVTDTFDEAQGTYTLTVKQRCPATPGQTDKQPFHVPLAMGLLDHNGTPLKPLMQDDKQSEHPYTRVLEVTEPQQNFVFTGLNEKPVISLLRGFSAPVKVVRDWDERELTFLFAHDSDEFNRWDAGQSLMLLHLKQLVAAFQSGQPTQLQAEFVDAFRQTLVNQELDPALVAQAITLPSEAYIADQYETVDIDAIHSARNFMLRELAAALSPELLGIYQQSQVDGEYRFNAHDMARRSLRNRCLAYLMEVTHHFELGLEQYRQAKNMTDRMTALTCLVNHSRPEVEQVLEDFYRRWKHDAQVLEKWFAVQAQARKADTLVRVKSLMQHEAFSLKNPNKVRALIGRFCLGNPAAFHAVDGSGYRFLTENIIELDRLNPQIAARLVQAMIRWRRYDENRQVLMREGLARIRDQKHISKDVFEIVSRSLEQA